MTTHQLTGLEARRLMLAVDQASHTLQHLALDQPLGPAWGLDDQPEDAPPPGDRLAMSRASCALLALAVTKELHAALDELLGQELGRRTVGGLTLTLKAGGLTLSHPSHPTATGRNTLLTLFNAVLAHPERDRDAMKLLERLLS